MSYYLNQTSKSVIFSTCEWGNQNVWEWGYNVAQQWRIHIDHLPLWSFPKKNGQGLKELIEVMVTTKTVVGPSIGQVTNLNLSQPLVTPSMAAA